MKKSTQYKRMETIIHKQFIDYLTNIDSDLNDPKWERVVELCRDKHLPLGEAVEIVEQEFSER